MQEKEENYVYHRNRSVAIVVRGGKIVRPLAVQYKTEGKYFLERGVRHE